MARQPLLNEWQRMSAISNSPRLGHPVYPDGVQAAGQTGQGVRPAIPLELVNQNGFLGYPQAGRPNEGSENIGRIANGAMGPPPAARSPPSIPGWPTGPREVGKAGRSTLIWRLIDITMILVPFLLIVLAIFARIADGKAVLEYPGYKKVIGVTSVFVSIYPIVFAAVVGRTLDAIACSRVERGARIQFLEQVIGSTTVYNTINVHLRLRTFNIVAVVLFVLWSLSPLGGQGILRLISIGERRSTVTSPVGYANFSGRIDDSVFFSQKSTGVQLVAMNAVYRASIIATNATMSAPQDTWGNLKIPRFEALDQSSKDSEGWIKVPARDVVYTSLVGVPFVGVAQVGNSSFKMESRYYELSCEDPIKVSSDEEVRWQPQPGESPGVGSIRRPNSTGSSGFDSTFSVGTFTPYTNRFTGLANGIEGDTSNDDDSPRNINIQSVTGSLNSWNISTANCTIQASYVELFVRCVAQNCTVGAQRRSTRPNPYPVNYTPWENPQFAYFFSAYFTQATGSVNSASPFWYSTLSEDYVAVETNPLSTPPNNNNPLIDMSELSATQLSTRWGRLINTYFTISCVPQAMTGEYAPYSYNQFTALPSNFIPFSAVQAPATVTTSRQIYQTHLPYLILTLVSAAVLLVCAILGPTLKFFNVAPDLLGHVSSVTRDNPHFRALLPEGTGSVIGGYERAQLLKDLEIMIGDVSGKGEGEGGVGEIAFVPVVATSHAGGIHAGRRSRRLRRGRLYR